MGMLMIFCNEPKELVIELHGREQMWALKNELIVAKKRYPSA